MPKNKKILDLSWKC